MDIQLCWNAGENISLSSLFAPANLFAKCLTLWLSEYFDFAKVYNPKEKRNTDQTGLLLTYHMDMHH